MVYVVTVEKKRFLLEFFEADLALLVLVLGRRDDVLQLRFRLSAQAVHIRGGDWCTLLRIHSLFEALLEQVAKTVCLAADARDQRSDNLIGAGCVHRYRLHRNIDRGRPVQLHANEVWARRILVVGVRNWIC